MKFDDIVQLIAGFVACWYFRVNCCLLLLLILYN